MKSKYTRFLWAILLVLSVLLTACSTKPEEDVSEMAPQDKNLTENMVVVGLTEEQVENVLTVYHELGGDSALLDDVAYDEEMQQLSAVFDDDYTLNFSFNELGEVVEVSCDYTSDHHYIFYKKDEVKVQLAYYLVVGAEKERCKEMLLTLLYETYPDMTIEEYAGNELRRFAPWHIDAFHAAWSFSHADGEEKDGYYIVGHFQFTEPDGEVYYMDAYMSIYAEDDGMWIIDSAWGTARDEDGIAIDKGDLSWAKSLETEETEPQIV